MVVEKLSMGDLLAVAVLKRGEMLVCGYRAKCSLSVGSTSTTNRASPNPEEAICASRVFDSGFERHDFQVLRAA
jgi:hypothetical protein